MSSQEDTKLYINIYPPKLVVEENNKINSYKINIDNINKPPEEIFKDQKDIPNQIKDKYTDQLITALKKLSSAESYNPKVEYHLEKTFQCHEKQISKLILSKKADKFLTSSYDNTAILWDRITGQPLIKYKSHEQPVNAILFISNEEKILTGSFDTKIKLWNTLSDKEIKEYNKHTAEVVSLCTDKDEKLLSSASMDATCILWDLETGKDIYQFSDHKMEVILTEINKKYTNNYLLTGSYDSDIFIYDIKNGKKVCELLDHNAEISSCHFISEYNIISTSYDSTCKVWDIRKSKNENMLFNLCNHNGEVYDCNYCERNNYIATAGADAKCFLYDYGNNCKLIDKLDKHKNVVYKCVFSNDEGNKGNVNILTGSSDGNCIIWECQDGKIKYKQVLEGTGDEIFICDFSQDNNDIATVSMDNICKIYTKIIKVE